MLNKTTENQNSETKTISIVDIILIILKYKKRILLSSLFVCIISVVFYFFVLDLIYFSSASIKSSTKTSFGISGFENLPDIGGLEGLSGGSKSTKELALYEEILNSRRCLEPLIIKFNIMQRDEYDFLEDAIKDFKKNRLLIDMDRTSGILNVGVYDKDKELAKQMVEFLLDELNKINIELNITNAKNNREFIEKRYYLAKEDLSKSEDSLKSFQMIYGVAPDLKIKAAAQSVFALESELKAEEVKLDVIKQILSSDQPEVKTQEIKVKSLQNKIQEIQTSTDVNDFLSLGNSPNIALSYLRLERAVEIQQKILTFILPLYEQSKIEEKRETPTIILLEKPYVAERKAKPKRLTMVIVITFAAFLFISISVVLYETQIKRLITNLHKIN